MIEQGRYHARITDYGICRSAKGSQHPQVFIEFELLGRYESGQLLNCQPGRATHYKAITEKTIDWLIADRRSIGFEGTLQQFDPETPGAVNLFGALIEVLCDHEEYAGKTRERWSIYRERSRQRIEAKELAQLDAQFADRFSQAAVPDDNFARAGTDPDNMAQE